MLFILRQLRRSFFQPGKLKTYVAYAVGEILLIVVGILIAVQIGNWNERRIEIREEGEILLRIKGELLEAVSYIDLSSQNLRWAIDRLDKVAAVFSGKPIEDDFQFLSDVAGGARMGWGQPDIRQSAYLELLSSGKFGLIRDVGIRDEITGFYDNIKQQEKKFLSRVNDYAVLAYELVPRKSENMDSASENEVREGLGEDAYTSIVSKVLNSDLERRIIPLRNRYQLVLTQWSLITAGAQELIETIDMELEERN
jgi:hypothetical protein